MAINLTTAQPALAAAGIELAADFHALSSDQVLALLDLAKQQGYRAPASANGSLARCFFAALVRRARTMAAPNQ